MSTGNEGLVQLNTCCFTGHRSIPMSQRAILIKQLREQIVLSIKEGYRNFCAGGALGFDTIAAQIVLELKKDYPDISLILMLPCKNQAQRWTQNEIEEYERIKSLSDQIIYVSDSYYKGCMQKRNRQLVDRSSLCICYLTENTGGTFYTVNYARKMNIPIINIANG